MRWFLGILVALAAILAGAFFVLRTPDLDHETLVARYATPPSTFITLADGTSAHMRDQGNPSGPAVVLLHGSNSSLFSWEGWIAPLGDKYRIITVDLPGHGLTGATVADDYTPAGMDAFVTDFLNALDLDAVVIGGNSMGGGIAAAYAIDHPARVRALILVDAAGLPHPEGSKLPIGFTLAGIPVVNHLIESITPRSFVAEGLRTSYANPSLVTEEQIDLYHQLLLHPGNRRATRLRFSAGHGAPSVEGRLDQIAVETLVLWGREDVLIPVANATRFAEGIPGAVVVTAEGVGHVPQEEAPTDSAAMVRTFLDGLDL